MVGVVPEGVAPVLEADPGALCYHAAAEPHVEAVYERAAVAPGVHRAQIGRVLAELRLRDAPRSEIRRDALAQLRCILFGDQTPGWDFRVAPELRIAYLLVQIAVGQLLRLYLEVDAVRANRVQIAHRGC